MKRRTLLMFLSILLVSCSGEVLAQNCTEQEKLTAGDARSNDNFGIGLAVEGDRAIIGAPGSTAGAASSGAVYVFERSGGVWTETAKLTAIDGAPADNFGWSVALSGDTILVGATGDDDAGSNAGSVYVFVLDGGAWVEEAKLLPADAVAHMGFAISVSLDGNTALVGANHETTGGVGAAYVFVRSGSTWSEEAKLTPDDGAPSDEFGWSVSVAGDTAAVGARHSTGGAVFSGAAYVFKRAGSVWMQEDKLIASDASFGDEFGVLSLWDDTVVVGAQQDDDLGANSGAAYVFTRSGATWTEEAKLVASDGASGDRFGTRVALAGDLVLVGSPYDDDSGSIYVYERNGGLWPERQKLVASDPDTGDVFGGRVAVSNATLAASAFYSDDAGPESGSVYVFVCSPGMAVPALTTLGLNGLILGLVLIARILSRRRAARPDATRPS